MCSISEALSSRWEMITTSESWVHILCKPTHVAFPSREFIPVPWKIQPSRAMVVHSEEGSSGFWKKTSFWEGKAKKQPNQIKGRLNFTSEISFSFCKFKIVATISPPRNFDLGEYTEFLIHEATVVSRQGGAGEEGKKNPKTSEVHFVSPPTQRV